MGGGYWAMGSESSATPPVRVIRIDSTAAKIGRSMKNREIMADPPEVSNQKSEVRGRKSKVGSQRSDVRGPNSTQSLLLSPGF